MTTYFRSKNEPIQYYSGVPVYDDGLNPQELFVLREIGTTRAIAITPDDLIDGFQQCSPFEALSVISAQA